MPALLASIPSPSSPEIGPFRVYGLLLAIATVVGVVVAEHRWRRRGLPHDTIYDLAFWMVVWGVIGARLYHVATDYQRFTGDPARAFAIWNGGLSIWGAVLGGAIAVTVMTRRHHLPTLAVMDCLGPAIALAQAIGRWGNYFNQELFGKPTTLPWGLEISPVHRPLGYERFATFHPMFLYESLYCLALFSALLFVERRLRLREGQTFASYVAGYTFGRFWFENLRIDPAHQVVGLRVNAWVALLCFVGSLAWMVHLGRSRQSSRVGRPPPQEPSA